MNTPPPLPTSNRIQKRRSRMEKRANTVKISTFNVRGARNAKLVEILRAFEQCNWEVGIITETHLTGYHTNGDKNYNVYATKAESPHKGGVALAWKKRSENWCVEAPRTHGPNVVSAFLVTGDTRWLIIGVYLAPTTMPDQEIIHIEEARKRTSGHVVVTGDLNYRERNNDERSIAIQTCLHHVGTSFEIGSGFWPRHGHRDRNTWRSLGGAITARCDYIYATFRSGWTGYRRTRPRGVCTDHLMLTASLKTEQR